MIRNIGIFHKFNGLRATLALTALLPLTGCGTDSFSRDPFSDASARCGEDRGEWRPGCATMANIAAQADNRRDLDTPRREAPRDAMRRDALISGYARSNAGDEPPRGASQAAPTSGTGKEP
jgi:hypothetical protein